MGYNEEIFILVGEGSDERATSCEFFNHHKGEIRKKYAVAWLLSGFVSIRENIQRRYFQSLIVQSVVGMLLWEAREADPSRRHLAIAGQRERRLRWPIRFREKVAWKAPTDRK